MAESESHKARVLFLCVHNSGRSQMAEAFLRTLAGDLFDVESAGFEPRPVLPEVVQVMKLAGIDLSQARSKSVFELFRAGRMFDYVITVCDEATAERCPIFPGVCERIHWTFDDPSAIEGSQSHRLERVTKIRDQVRERLESWIEEKRTTGPLPRFGQRPENRTR
jgi:arsenate reductase (thioredoxin)